jgi:hypothetical protein
MSNDSAEFEKKYKKYIQGVVLDMDASNNAANKRVLMHLAYEFYLKGIEWAILKGMMGDKK